MFNLFMKNFPGIVWHRLLWKPVFQFSEVRHQMMLVQFGVPAKDVDCQRRLLTVSKFQRKPARHCCKVIYEILMHYCRLVLGNKYWWHVTFAFQYLTVLSFEVWQRKNIESVLICKISPYPSFPSCSCSEPSYLQS